VLNEARKKTPEKTDEMKKAGDPKKADEGRFIALWSVYGTFRSIHSTRSLSGENRTLLNPKAKP
jgi:hypothetical protein